MGLIRSVALNTSGSFTVFSVQYCVRLDVNRIALFRIQAALNKRGDINQQALRTRERVSSWNVCGPANFVPVSYLISTLMLGTIRSL